ncbi:MAG: YhcH/YjgK/YiaL family protein, partial [Bacteroidaceae bacterium]|nr:YhcH/YjgK/YiaL family protein [Bacteroidaceae bacterium]
MTEAEIISLWHSLPLSADNDLSALSVQIGKNPEAWEAAGLFLKHTDLSALSLGRHEIGQGCYANVQEYETKTTSKYELHRRYIDVQLLGFGEELVYVAPKDQ